MDWKIMVIGQLGLLLLGTAGACLWQIRKLKRNNQALFEALEAAQGGSDATVPAETQDAAANSELAEAPVADSATDTSNERAPEEPAPAPSEPPETAPTESAQPKDPGTDGVKKLLQQFTIDSRDMVTRIEVLEQQLQDLISAAATTEATSADDEGLADSETPAETVETIDDKAESAAANQAEQEEQVTAETAGADEAEEVEEPDATEEAKITEALDDTDNAEAANDPEAATDNEAAATAEPAASVVQ